MPKSTRSNVTTIRQNVQAMKARLVNDAKKEATKETRNHYIAACNKAIRLQLLDSRKSAEERKAECYKAVDVLFAEVEMAETEAEKIIIQQMEAEEVDGKKEEKEGGEEEEEEEDEGGAETATAEE